MSLHTPEFKYITNEILQEWKGSNPSFRLPDPVPISRFLYELCWSMVRGDLSFQKCKLALDSVLFEDEEPKVEMGSILADIIAHMCQDARSLPKRSVHNPVGKKIKQELVKDDAKAGKSINRTTSHPAAMSDRDFPAHLSEGRQGGNAVASLATTNGSTVSKVSTPSARMVADMHGKMDSGAMRTSDDFVEGHETSRTISAIPTHSSFLDDSFTKQQKRTAVEEQDKVNKRRKGDSERKDGEGLDTRLMVNRAGVDEHNLNKSTDKHADKSKDKIIERYDKDRREKLDHSDRNREDVLDKSRDRSLERHGRERSVEKGVDRNIDRSVDKARDDRNKDDRSKTRQDDGLDERFHGQNLPPPPPSTPMFVPQSVGGNRRDEEADRRVGSTRHIQRLSPRHDEKERRRSEEAMLGLQDDGKRRREDFRERKHDEREGVSAKGEERDRDKGSILKEDIDSAAATKRRKLKRDHASSSEPGEEYSPVMQQPPLHLTMGFAPSFDTRDRGDRKGMIGQHRAGYMDEQGPRINGKESTSKVNQRETDQVHEREWEGEKRQRTDAKRKHRK